MGEPTYPPPALLLMAVTSRHGEALDWARARAEETWGPVALESARFDFKETAYYEATMGAGLLKLFLVFAAPYDSACAVETKLQTNAWESEYTELQSATEARPLNLDPGYMTAAKLVLTSTKDHAHRIYLGRGIYAEGTLFFQHGAWRPRDWTFPDYRREDYHAFFTEARNLLRRREREAGGA